MFNFFVKQHKVAQIFTFSMILLGIASMVFIKKDKFPSVDLDTMIINTPYPNASPIDVEYDVTIPIEDELKKVNGIDEFSSISKENGSIINIKLDPNEGDVNITKQNIRTALSAAKSLPKEAESSIVMEIKTSHMVVLQINLSAKGLSYTKLKDISDSIKEKLKLSHNISSIDENGVLDSEVKIYLQPEKLKQYNLSLNNIISTIKNHNYRYTAGDNNSNTSNANIVVLAKFKSLGDVENLILKANFDGKNIKLKDVASIKQGFVEKINIIRVNGIEGVVLNVHKKANADIIETVDEIKNTVKNMQSSLPSVVEIFYTADLSKEVRNRLKIVSNNGITGFILVILALSIFLSIRTAFWVAVGMFVSLLGTVLLLWVSGESINLISLAAIIIVLGIVVDDSIIIAESISNAMEKDNSYNGVVIGIKKVIKPIITTITTTILAMSSMFLMEGTMGKFIYIIPLVVIFALSLSLAEVIIALPSHLSTIKNTKSRIWFKSVEKVFLIMISKILKFRYIVIIVFIALAVATFVFVKNNMSFNLFPKVGSDTINIFLDTGVNSSLEHTAKISDKLEQKIMTKLNSKLDFISSKIGAQKSYQVNLSVKLNSYDYNTDKIIDTIRAISDGIDNIKKIDFSTIRPGPKQDKDIKVVLVGKNDINRTKAMDKLENILQKIDGVSDIRRDDEIGKKRLEVIFDFDAMSRLGVAFSAVQNYLRASFSGIKITKIRKNNNDIDYRLFLGKNQQGTEVIDKIFIANNSNKLVPMKSFIDIREIKGEADINHFNGERSIAITASIDDKKNTSAGVIKKITETIDINNSFPDIRLLVEGGAKENQESMRSFANAFIMAVIGIFLLLALLFNSYTQPMVVISSIPFALIGVIWAFYFHGQTFSFFAILGSLALVGVIVNDALVLVSHLNDIKKITSDNLIKWVARGVTDRLRAIVLTSVTTLAGVLPLAYGIGGIDYLLQPMALSLGYGLLFGTLITLILLPCLYMMNYEIVDFFTKKFNTLFANKYHHEAKKSS